MNRDAIAVVTNLVGTFGVIVTLIYLAIQVRGNTRLTSAQSRHTLSDFVLRIAIFRAENADRLARLESGENLIDGASGMTEKLSDRR